VQCTPVQQTFAIQVPLAVRRFRLKGSAQHVESNKHTTSPPNAKWQELLSGPAAVGDSPVDGGAPCGLGTAQSAGDEASREDLRASNTM
jgi:hypothetical protein